MDDITIETTKTNNEMIEALKKMGGALDPLAFVQMQMQAMVELLFDKENLEKLEALYQQKLNEVLGMALKQAREVQIMIREQDKKLVKPARPRLIKPGEN